MWITYDFVNRFNASPAGLCSCTAAVENLMRVCPAGVERAVICRDYDFSNAHHFPWCVCNSCHQFSPSCCCSFPCVSGAFPAWVVELLDRCSSCGSGASFGGSCGKSLMIVTFSLSSERSSSANRSRWPSRFLPRKICMVMFPLAADFHCSRRRLALASFKPS